MSNRTRSLQYPSKGRGRLAIAAGVGIAAVAVGIITWSARSRSASIENVAHHSAALSIPVIAHTASVPESARLVINRAVEHCQRNPTAESFSMLGRVYHGNGLTHLAMECYELARSLGADDALTTYLHGAILLEEGRLTEAAKAFRSSISFDGTYPLAHYHLGRSLLQLGQHDAAESAFARAVHLDESDPILLIGLAAAQRQLGRLGEAESTLRRAIALEPEHPEAHQMLGLVLHALDRSDEAQGHLGRIRSYSATVYNDPWMWEAHRHAASVTVRLERVRHLLRFGRLEGAYGLIRELLAQYPSDPDVLRVYGDVLHRMGRHQQAINAYAKAADLNPDNAHVHLSMTQIFITHGMLDEAEMHLSLAMEIDPLQVEGRIMHGVIALRRGRYDDAIDWLEAALSDRPSDLVTAAYLAEAMIAVGEYSTAIEMMTGAIHAAGGESIAYLDYQLGTALLQVGRLEDAEQVLRRGQASDPENPHIAQKLATFRGMQSR